MAKGSLAKQKKCRASKCPNKAASPRAMFCRLCFVKKATTANRKRKTFKGNKGARGVVGNKGGSGVVGNKGGSGVVGNDGNRTIGKKRVDIGTSAGKRSGLRRCAPIALVIKEQWLTKIFSRKKKWEIRSQRTKRRGRIHLARPGGLLVGSASISGCSSIARKDFMNHRDKHCVPSLSMVDYPRIWAWHLESVQKYEKPFRYTKLRGAITWVHPKPVARSG